MDRRAFVGGALTAAGAALLSQNLHATGEEQVPGAVSSQAVAKARFPDGFLWGVATAA